MAEKRLVHVEKPLSRQISVSYLSLEDTEVLNLFVGISCISCNGMQCQTTE